MLITAHICHNLDVLRVGLTSFFRDHRPTEPALKMHVIDSRLALKLLLLHKLGGWLRLSRSLHLANRVIVNNLSVRYVPFRVPLIIHRFNTLLLLLASPDYEVIRVRSLLADILWLASNYSSLIITIFAGLVFVIVLAEELVES